MAKQWDSQTLFSQLHATESSACWLTLFHGVNDLHQSRLGTTTHRRGMLMVCFGVPSIATTL